MRRLLLVLLAMLSLVLVVVSALPGRTTVHIGSRQPPADAGCWRSGEVQTDEGRWLGVYRCPWPST